MSLYVSKVAGYLLYPLSLAFLLVLLAALSWRRRRRLSRTCLSAALGGLWLCSTPFVADTLRAALETRHPPQALAELPRADAILVLGGILSGPQPPYSLHINLHGDVDRLWHAARLYHAGKAPLMIVVGGNLPWSTELRPEAELLAELLEQLSVPRSAMLLETRSASTRQNAYYSKALLAEHRIDSVYLVTSAMHMPRALATFRAQGLNVLPAAIDYRIPARASLWLWLPDARALLVTSQVLREFWGYAYYKIRGWID